MENILNSQKRKKNGKILSSCTKNTLYCSDNLAQKLDNSVEIVKISGHA